MVSAPYGLCRKTSRGFTLLEALIAVSIVAILLIIGVPVFRDLVASRSVLAHVSDLAGTIRLARTEAIKRGVPVTMCRTDNPLASNPSCASGTDWSSGWLLFADRGTRGTVDTGDFIIRIQQGYNNSGGIVRSSGAAITFLPTGIAPGSQSNFLIRPKLATDLDSYASLTQRMCMNSTGATRLLHGETTCG